MVELKSPEAQHLQQQQDLHLSDLQQHMVIWQQPAFDKEVPQNQVRLHLMETLQGKERCDQGMDATVWAPECGICWCSGCYGVMYFGKYILRSPAKTFMKVTFWDSAPRPRIATARVPILTVPF